MNAEQIRQTLQEFRKTMNLRDLGGYASADGRRVRHGTFYRSAGLFLMNEKELAALASLGIRTVLDLRSTEEMKEKPDPPLAGAKMLPPEGTVFLGGNDIDFSPAGMHRMGEGGREQYQLIHDYYMEMPFNNDSYRMLMREVEADNVPFLFHCAAGKDRTGLAAMIVLLALGVPEETVFEDYVLSNEYLAEDIARAEATHRETIAADPIHSKLIHFEVCVLPEFGREILDTIRARCGSHEAYLEQEFGLSRERLTALRDRYLVS